MKQRHAAGTVATPITRCSFGRDRRRAKVISVTRVIVLRFVCVWGGGHVCSADAAAVSRNGDIVRLGGGFIIRSVPGRCRWPSLNVCSLHQT